MQSRPLPPPGRANPKTSNPKAKTLKTNNRRLPQQPKNSPPKSSPLPGGEGPEPVLSLAEGVRAVTPPRWRGHSCLRTPNKNSPLPRGDGPEPVLSLAEGVRASPSPGAKGCPKVSKTAQNGHISDTFRAHCGHIQPPKPKHEWTTMDTFGHKSKSVFLQRTARPPYPEPLLCCRGLSIVRLRGAKGLKSFGEGDVG